MTTKDQITKEIEELDHEIARLEAEKAGLPPIPSWDQLQDAGVLGELQEREARRGVLPHLLRAARIKHLELQRSKEERELKPLQQRQDKAYQRLEAAREEKIRAEEALGEATAAWSDSNLRVQSRQTKVRHIDRQIKELKNDG